MHLHFIHYLIRVDDKEEVVLKHKFCINAQSSLLKSVVLFEEKLLQNTKNKECFISFNLDYVELVG